MFARILLVALCMLVAVGCKKRTPPTTPVKDDLANVKLQQPPAPTPAADKKGEKEDAPNWLKDDRFNKKDQLPADGPATPGKQPWNVGPPQGGFTAPVPGVQPAPAPGVAGALQPQPSPVPAKPPVAAPPTATPPISTKRVEVADMKEVWTFIENASGASGKMPPAALTYAALVKAESPAAALVKDQAIIITGATTRESVWAYEARAPLDGGLVASQNGVETLTAAEVRARLKK